MRNRLTMLLVAAVLLTGILIGIPLVAWADYGIRHQAKEQLQESVDRTVALLDQRFDQGLPNNAAALGPYVAPQREVRITALSTGEETVYGTVPAGRSVIASAEGDHYLVESRGPIAGSSVVIGLRILTTTLVASVIAYLVARRWTRRLADAMEELAQDAERIGSGDTRPARRHGMDDLDLVAKALDDSSRRVHELVRVERAFTSDLTHQLRTPLTAISLRLDEVAAADDLATARIEAAAAQEQVERLAEVISDLHQAALQREVERGPFEIDPVMERQFDEWRGVFKAQGRMLVGPAPTGLRVLGTPGAFGQVLATLLDNASVHGAGRVSVTVRQSGSSVVVEISDEGPGVPAALGARVFERSVSGGPSGSGLGLSLARALAEHMGGRLELVSAQPAVFGLFLERADEEGESDGDASDDQARDAMASAESS